MTALFVCDHLQIKTRLKFLLDTDNTNTTLTERTAKSLGIDIKSLPQRVKITGIGGSSEGYLLAGIRIIFHAKNGVDVEEKLSFVRILKTPSPRNPEEAKALELIPDLPGLDILGRFTIRFEKHSVYLDREDATSDSKQVPSS